jgi:AcrR family transcriptional regulator
MAGTVRNQTQDESLVAARRRQIFLAACRVLARKSFHEASVKELALEAGLAAGSIYVYLRGKDDILLLVADSMVAELEEALPSIRARTSGDPQRELLDVIRTILDIIDRYREAFSVLHHEARYLAKRPQYRDAMNAIAARYLSAVSDVIDRGRALGVIHTEDVASAVHAVHMLCAGWAVRSHSLRKTSKESYWRQIAAMIAGGLFAAPAEPPNGAAAH